MLVFSFLMFFVLPSLLKGHEFATKCINASKCTEIADRDKIARLEDDKIRLMLKEMLRDYNPKLRPNYLGSPVRVEVDATILSFTNVDVINMMYTVDMYFRQRWSDHRLKHNLSESLMVIVGTSHPSNIIWTPDTVFINSVTSRLHHVTVENHKLDIFPNGSVFWGTRITVSPSCQLDLKAYPMDVQLCSFEIVSYTYDSRHLKYDWHWNPGIKIERREMAQFLLTDQRTVMVEEIFVAGNYTVLRGIFRFKRLMGFAILQIYVPSTAIVMVSWVSLWIKRTATPARVSLCITTLLTISTIWSSVNSQLPRVNYVKAVDIYLMTSFCCVIFTLLEYTIILNIPVVMEMVRKKSSLKPKVDSILLQTMMPDSQNGISQGLRATQYVTMVTQGVSAKNVDKDEAAKLFALVVEAANEKIANKLELCARFFFPLVYLLFNILYWTTYLQEDPDTMI